MTDECADFWYALQQAATPEELGAIRAAALRAGLFRECVCGKLLEPNVPRCWECKAWRSEADRQRADELIRRIHSCWAQQSQDMPATDTLIMEDVAENAGKP